MSKNIDIQSICSMSMTWRYQKNMQNGETKFMARNDKHPNFCAVRAALRIQYRARAAGSKPLSPVAIYATKGGQQRLLTNKHMEDLLRRAAKAVYRITSPQHLQRFSCHSIRVGACVMLHCAHFTDTEIQFELRWRSNSFKDYLRNVLCTACRKRYALTNFDPDEVEF